MTALHMIKQLSVVREGQLTKLTFETVFLRESTDDIRDPFWNSILWNISHMKWYFRDNP